MIAIAHALTAALLHFVWQGALVAFLLWAAMFLLRNRSANSRYVAACIAMSVLLLLPVVTAYVSYAPPARVAGTVVSITSVHGSPLAAGPVPTAWLAAIETWALPVWSF